MYAELENIVELTDVRDQFKSEIENYGFSDFSFHLYTAWNDGSCPDITLTTLAPGDGIKHDATVARILVPNQADAVVSGGAFWMDAGDAGERIFVLPYEGKSKERGFATLVPSAPDNQSVTSLSKLGQDFFAQAIEILRRHGIIKVLPDVTELERLSMTLYAEGLTSPEELRWHGLSVDKYEYLLGVAVRKFHVNSIKQAVAIAKRLGIINPFVMQFS